MPSEQVCDLTDKIEDMSLSKKFNPPEIANNSTGWGPSLVPKLFQDIPYQPFSKADRVGKFSDWSGNYHERRQMSNYGSGGNAFTYVHDNDESNFSTITTGLVKQHRYVNRRFVNFRRNYRNNPNRYLLNNKNDYNKMQELGRGKQKRRLGNAARTAQNRYSSLQNRAEKRTHTASVTVSPDWKLLQTIQFGQLANLSYDPSAPKDLKMCGMLEFYNKAYDGVHTKSSKPLQQMNRLFHNVMTTEDPVIREFASKNEGRVFCTDTLLAAIMSTRRSNYSWDIIVQRFGDKVFLDKRDGSNLDYLQVCETSPHAPNPEDEVKINTPDQLAMEATYINHNFSQQCLNSKASVKFANPNPFHEDGATELPSSMYRYRKYNIGKDLDLVVRCTVDAGYKDPSGKNVYASVKAINEYTAKGATEWKRRLDIQPGAVFAAELKKNSCKMSRWAITSLLCGSDIFKLGYVVRNNPKDKTKHTILGVQTYKPKEFAKQINLDIHNSWGILRTVVDMALKQPEGKYLLFKAPNEKSLQFFAVADDEFENEESDEE